MKIIKHFTRDLTHSQYKINISIIIIMFNFYWVSSFGSLGLTLLHKSKWVWLFVRIWGNQAILDDLSRSHPVILGYIYHICVVFNHLSWEEHRIKADSIMNQDLSKGSPVMESFWYLSFPHTSYSMYYAYSLSKYITNIYWLPVTQQAQF